MWPLISDKMFLIDQLIYSFMPKLLKKSWMVSTNQYNKVPLFFWFDLFLEARAEILKKISLAFWSKRWHQKDILKLTDLYKYNI